MLATGSAREPGPVWVCEQTLWPAQGRLDKESQSFRHLVCKFIDKGMHFCFFFWHFLWHSISAILSVILSNILSSILFQTSIWYFLHSFQHLFLHCMPFYLPFMISGRRTKKSVTVSGILFYILGHSLCSWGPESNALIWSSRLRSGGGHSGPVLAVWYYYLYTCNRGLTGITLVLSYPTSKACCSGLGNTASRACG